MQKLTYTHILNKMEVKKISLEDVMTTAIISAATAIIVVVLGDLLSGARTLKRLEKHDEKNNLDHQEQLREHKQQNHDHKVLLDESSNLKIDSKLLLKLSEKMNGKIETIDKTLFSEKETKKMQYESLSDKQKEMKNSLDKLIGFADELEKVNLHNAKIQRELNDLLLENKELRMLNRRLREKIHEIQHGDEYEISR